MRKMWKEEEDNFLKQSYFQRGVRYCSHELERSVGSVAHRVSRLGITRRGEGILRARCEQGYIVIQGNYVRRPLHILIAEMKIGRRLEKGELAHHTDGDLLNNHPNNIAVMTIAEHQRAHWGDNCDRRRSKKTGRFM